MHSQGGVSCGGSTRLVLDLPASKGKILSSTLAVEEAMGAGLTKLFKAGALTFGGAVKFRKLRLVT